jgi:hypothetical protein
MRAGYCHQIAGWCEQFRSATGSMGRIDDGLAVSMMETVSLILPGFYGTGLRNNVWIIQPAQVAWSKLAAAAIKM